MAINYGTNNVTGSGLLTFASGNFTQSLTLNGTGVSVSGHTHTSSNITDFNSSVSGLLPTIANSGDNRVLTSTGSSLGINAEANLTFDGTNLSTPYLLVTNASGDEGGEIQLAKPPSGTLSGGITIDAYQNKLRFFEQGGSARGFYLDISTGGAAASTNLGGSVVSSPSISGVGVSGYVAIWNAPSGLSSGIIYDNLSGVGIGTSSPTYRLDIASTGSNLLRIVDSSTNRFVFEKTSGNYSSLTTADNGGRKFAVASHPNDLATDVAYVAAVAQNVGAGATLSSPFNADSNHISIRARGDIVHFAALGGSVTERLRITSSGNVGIGNSSPAYRLDVTGTGNFTGNLYASGNVGIGTSSPAYKLHVSGSFAATTKSFSIDHPSKPEMTLNYGSLESPYHGVRLTGRDSLSDGYCVVSLPDYIKDLVHDDDDLNVQITNYKHGKILYVDSIDLNNNQFIVRCDSAYSNNLEFFWTFTGTRKDVDRLIVERTE